MDLSPNNIIQSFPAGGNPVATASIVGDMGERFMGKWGTAAGRQLMSLLNPQALAAVRAHRPLTAAFWPSQCSEGHFCRASLR